jgi:hypothetical protein
VEATVRVAAYLSQYTSLPLVLEAICSDVARRFAAPLVLLYRYEREHDQMVLAAATGVPPELLEEPGPLPHASYARLIDAEEALMLLPDMQAAPELPHHALALSLDLHSALSVPLRRAGDMAGMLLTMSRQTTPDIAAEDADVLRRLADQAALIVTNGHLFNELSPRSADILEGWMPADEQRDVQDTDHTYRVADLTVRLAHVMGMRPPHLVLLRLGALLHTIGRLGIPDAILRKPGALTAEEWMLMRQQPIYAHEMLTPIDFLHVARDIPYCHHERWDGSGYPRGLKGEGIPLAARVFAVVDVWDTLLYDRPGRPAWAHEHVQEYLAEQAGKQFDPRIVAAFLRMIQGTWTATPGPSASGAYEGHPRS